jgi:hypothetical protein
VIQSNGVPSAEQIPARVFDGLALCEFIEGVCRRPWDSGVRRPERSLDDGCCLGHRLVPFLGPLAHRLPVEDSRDVLKDKDYELVSRLRRNWRGLPPPSMRSHRTDEATAVDVRESMGHNDANVVDVIKEALMESVEGYWLPKEFSAHARWSDKKTYRLIQSDPTFPALKIGKSIRIPKARALRWLRDREQGRK